MLSPCKGCESRYLYCHAECPDYITFQKDRERVLNAKYEYNKKQQEVNSYKVESICKEYRNEGKRAKKLY